MSLFCSVAEGRFSSISRYKSGSLDWALLPLLVVDVLLFLPRGSPTIGLPLMFSLMFLDEQARIVVDESSGTRLRRVPKPMSSSCWEKGWGEGSGEISRNGDRAAAATGIGAAVGAGTSSCSSSTGKLE